MTNNVFNLLLYCCLMISGVVECKSNDVDVDELSDDTVIGDR